MTDVNIDPDMAGLVAAPKNRMGFRTEGDNPTISPREYDDEGLSLEETRAVRVRIRGGDPYVDIQLLEVIDEQHNPSSISGSKEFGVEIIQTTPNYPLVQNTQKYGVWQMTFVVDTSKKKYSDKFKVMNAGPYVVDMSLFQMKMYCKKLAFVQHPSREWYYTWTLDMVEMRSKPDQSAIIGETEDVEIPTLPGML